MWPFVDGRKVNITRFKLPNFLDRRVDERSNHETRSRIVWANCMVKQSSSSDRPLSSGRVERRATIHGNGSLKRLWLSLNVRNLVLILRDLKVFRGAKERSGTLVRSMGTGRSRWRIVLTRRMSQHGRKNDVGMTKN